MYIARNRTTGNLSEKTPSRRRPHHCIEAYLLPKWAFPMSAHYTRVLSLHPPPIHSH